MELGIKYSNRIQPPANAAFIRGADAKGWLTEIDSWDILFEELECYVMPTSLKDPETSGLFVIFKDAKRAKDIQLLEPYTCIENKLYIPVDTELVPQVTALELKELLLWEKQVLHPSIGFIGFEEKDRFDLSKFFEYNIIPATDWSFANPGAFTRPGFNQILVMQKTPEDLMSDIKEGVGEKPLNEIPIDPSKDPSALGKIFDGVKIVMLKGVLGLMRVLVKITPVSDAVGNSNRVGTMERLVNWITQNLDELQKRRNDEIKRLLTLFDDDNDEALRYAIPLNSPYLDRGSAGVGSDRLTRRPSIFDLSSLGGGRVVDGWDLGNYYNDLRTKYLNAAKREIDNKNFKKAAYVYAHLLGDYSSAANVLEQGGMYREAAVIYKDHLKTLPAAAECLERGGLYSEAIEVFKGLERNEKVGDLYTKLQQQDKGVQYYEKFIEERISNSDHMEAARVINEKLDQLQRAKQTLLEGWKGYHLAEPCLKEYFNIVLNKEPGNTEKELNEVFNKHTPRHKQVALLNVLEYVAKKNVSPKLAETTQDIAYEIIHKETDKGNSNVLASLRKFVPGDKLIGSDASRYATSNHVRKLKSGSPMVFHLDQNINWLQAVSHRSQFLALGIKDGSLQMVRGNWYGNVEYYSWSFVVKRGASFRFINAPYYSNSVIILSTDNQPITRKNLPRNKYFTEALAVYCPTWMHNTASQCVMNESQDICRLEITDQALTMHYYSLDGVLQKSINCVHESQLPLTKGVARSEMINRDEYYYTYQNKEFLIIAASGIARIYDLETGIRHFAVSQPFTEFQLVISTIKGCLFCKPVKGELRIQGDFFAINLIPSITTFVGASLFVIAEKKRATLFEINDVLPNEIKHFDTHTRIVAVLPTGSRNQFALLEESGRFTMCDTNE